MGLVFLAMVSLVAAGLNISNEGISDLVGESRKAVVAINVIHDSLNLQWLGVEYNYPEPARVIMQGLNHYLNLATDYLLSIWTIFAAVFLSG